MAVERLIKLTDESGRTRAGFPEEKTWVEGVEHQATGPVAKLCTDGVIHAYRTPLRAVFMNPIHADFKNPLAWEAEGEVLVSDGTKVGCLCLKTTKRVGLPKVTFKQRIRFGIACAYLTGRVSPAWVVWADGWVSGKDRSGGAAEAAAWAAAAWTGAAWAARAAAAGAAAAAWAAGAAEGAARVAGEAVGEALLTRAENWAVSGSLSLGDLA